MKMKLIAAALATLAAGSAQAAIQISQLQSPAPELYFAAWYEGDPDSTLDDKSYSRDLDGAFTTLLGSPVVSGVGSINNWASASNPSNPSGHLPLVADKTSAGYLATYAADATLTAWLNTFTPAQLATIRWNVTSADSYGAMRALTTAKTVPTGTGRQNYMQFRAWDDQWDTHVANVSNMPGHGPLLSDDGSNTATFADGNAYAGGIAWGSRWGGASNFDTHGLVGEELNFYAFWEHTPIGFLTTKVNYEQYLCSSGDCDPNNLAGKWRFASDGTLTYAVAAVPEADTYALVLAGMGLVGFLARRRRAA